MADIDTDLDAALRETARDLLVAMVSTERLRRGPAAPREFELSAEFTRAGWWGLEVPEELGGAGLGFRELCILLHEMGRVLLPGPFFATTVLGVGALASASAAQRARWLPGIAGGSRHVTAALAGNRGVPGSLDVRVTRDGSGWRLDGTAPFVPELESADAVVVAAADAEGGSALFLVTPTHEGVTIVPQPTIDTTRRLARLALTSVRLEDADSLGTPGAAGEVLGRLCNRAAIAMSADCLGGAERLLAMTVEYLKNRKQFGRPIGSFQALKHRCADMLMGVEMARSATEHAAAVAPEEAQYEAAASIAKATAAEVYMHVAAEAVSLHGGIGFTWEHDAHLYLKRAGLDALLFGDVLWHRDRLARLALGGASQRTRTFASA